MWVGVGFERGWAPTHSLFVCLLQHQTYQGAGHRALEVECHSIPLTADWLDDCELIDKGTLERYTWKQAIYKCRWCRPRQQGGCFHSKQAQLLPFAPKYLFIIKVFRVCCYEPIAGPLGTTKKWLPSNTLPIFHPSKIKWLGMNGRWGEETSLKLNCFVSISMNRHIHAPFVHHPSQDLVLCEFRIS